MFPTHKYAAAFLRIEPHRNENAWAKAYPNLVHFLARIAPPECAEEAAKERA